MPDTAFQIGLIIIKEAAIIFNRPHQQVDQEPQVCQTLEVVIPRAAYKELGVNFYSNKTILAFEGWTLTNQAKQWIALYN
jgi:hypothetical protein